MTIDILSCLIQIGLLPSAVGYRLTPMMGGFSNGVYRLQGNGCNWVIRHFGATDNILYPILPADEAQALQTLRGLKIAPEPIAFFPEIPLIVYEFVVGDIWQEDASEVGRLLRRLHDVPVSPNDGFRHLPVTTDAILQQADHFLDQVTPNTFTKQLRTLRPSPKSHLPARELSLIHTDPWITNIVQSGNQLRLIDWQCPGLGDPVEDVWVFLRSGFEMLIGRPRFGPHVELEFWRGYGETTVHHLSFLAPYYAYRLAAHCCLRQQQIAATKHTLSTTSTNHTLITNYQKIFAYLITDLTLNAK
jgi:thiamine kinase